MTTASTMLFTAVFALDFICFLLALAAEQTRTRAMVTVDSDYNYTYCVYDSNIATILGGSAAGFFFSSQLLNYFLTRKRSSKHRGVSTISLAICLISFLGAEACLVVGSVKNAHRTKYRAIYGFGDLDCETLGAGVFEAGAIFIMICSFASKLNHGWSWSDTKEEFQNEPLLAGDQGRLPKS
ncbi:hypothetical protein LINGRAHAP2_LOCUS29203 [Linum grandiflorum]